MNGKMKGWNFLSRQKKLSADGSTTLDTLRAEKNRLEARYAQIPGLISQIQNNIKLTQHDIDWLSSLNNRRQKNWEKENGGKQVGDVIYQAKNKIVAWKAQISTMNTEKSRIPEQIKAIDRQIEAMVQGESQGLSKGLNSATAAQMGLLELERAKEDIEKEQQLKELEIQKQQELTQMEIQKAKEQQGKLSPTLKWSLIIGGTVLLLIIGFVIYKRRLNAKALSTVVANPPVNPL